MYVCIWYMYVWRALERGGCFSGWLLGILGGTEGYILKRPFLHVVGAWLVTEWFNAKPWSCSINHPIFNSIPQNHHNHHANNDTPFYLQQYPHTTISPLYHHTPTPPYPPHTHIQYLKHRFVAKNGIREQKRELEGSLKAAVDEVKDLHKKLEHLEGLEVRIYIYVCVSMCMYVCVYIYMKR